MKSYVASGGWCFGWKGFLWGAGKEREAEVSKRLKEMN
jgi:hypothetical protein